VKRSIRIAGHRTSLSLEAPYWEALKEIAAVRGLSLAALVGEIDASRGRQNLSSAIRLHVLEKARAGELPSATRRTA
jgi:predicted DNA-binding ribbon-helix-helix protein